MIKCLGAHGGSQLGPPCCRETASCVALSPLPLPRPAEIWIFETQSHITGGAQNQQLYIIFMYTYRTYINIHTYITCMCVCLWFYSGTWHNLFGCLHASGILKIIWYLHCNISLFKGELWRTRCDVTNMHIASFPVKKNYDEIYLFINIIIYL